MRQLMCCSRALVFTAPLAGSLAHAEVIVVAPVADATLYQDAAGGFASGAGTAMFAGTNSGSSIRRSAIRFDIAGAVPAGATITGVTLRLHNSASNVGTQTVSLHRMLESWTEGPSAPTGAGGSGVPSMPGDVTWLHRTFPGLLWSTPGGVFEGSASAATMVGGIGLWTWESTPSLAADVQSWLDAPGGNFGWMVVGQEGVASSARRFATREETDPNIRPVLTVTYVPEPAAGLLVAAGAAAGGRRRRRTAHTTPHTPTTRT